MFEANAKHMEYNLQEWALSFWIVSMENMW